MTELTPGSRRKLLRHIREGYSVIELSKEMGLWRKTINKMIEHDVEIGDEFDFSANARKHRLQQKHQKKIDIAKDRSFQNQMSKMRIIDIRESSAVLSTGKDIIAHWAAIHCLKPIDLTGKSRNRYIVKVRQMAMYEMRRQLQYSFPMIGRMFGGRDHTTVLHAYGKMSEQFNRGPAQPIEPIAENVLKCLSDGKRALTIARDLGMPNSTVRTLVTAFERAA